METRTKAQQKEDTALGGKYGVEIAPEEKQRAGRGRKKGCVQTRQTETKSAVAKKQRAEIKGQMHKADGIHPTASFLAEDRRNLQDGLVMKGENIDEQCNATDEDISLIVKNNYYWFQQPCVKDDDELADRLNLFFNRIIKTGEIPTVEKLALALGITCRKMNDWERGANCTRTRQEMVVKAKAVLQAMDAELAESGKIPQVVYIFRAKNFYGMRDQAEITLQAPNLLGETQNKDDLMKRYTEDLADDDAPVIVVDDD